MSPLRRLPPQAHSYSEKGFLPFSSRAARYTPAPRSAPAPAGRMAHPCALGFFKPGLSGARYNDGVYRSSIPSRLAPLEMPDFGVCQGAGGEPPERTLGVREDGEPDRNAA